MKNHRGHREHGVKEFAGGYINTSRGVVKEDSVGGHLRRHAGAYLGTAMVPVLGTGIGALIDAARKRPNLIKTADERVVSAKTAALLGGERMTKFSANLNLKLQLRELAFRSERVVELASNWVGPSGVNSKGQRPEDNWRRGAGMGFLIGGAPGAILTQPLASKSAENKVIYRKRDATTDSLRIAGGGLAGGMLGSVAGRLAARGSAGPSLLPLVGNIAGLGAGLFGGYKWAKGANENRINEARVDRVKTGMASAYLNDQMKKRNARTASVSDSQGYVLAARRPDNE